MLGGTAAPPQPDALASDDLGVKGGAESLAAQPPVIKQHEFMSNNQQRVLLHVTGSKCRILVPPRDWDEAPAPHRQRNKAQTLPRRKCRCEKAARRRPRSRPGSQTSPRRHCLAEDVGCDVDSEARPRHSCPESVGATVAARKRPRPVSLVCRGLGTIITITTIIFSSFFIIIIIITITTMITINYY